ncbi:hypothetical protein Tco_1448485 [Tanacetum coccineum]
MLYGRPRERSSVFRLEGTVFGHCPLRICLKPRFDYFNLPLVSRDLIRGGETISDSIFKHDLCKLVIAKMRSTITDDGTGSTKSGKERFKEFANYSGAGSVLSFGGREAPLLQPFLTDSRCQIEAKVSGIKGPFLAVRFAPLMSPGGSIVASFENVESFLAVHTSSDHLIRTDFKQEGVIPEVVFNVFEKLVFCWDDISLTTKFPAW